MKLHIENIKAIGSADILLDGITVIVGNNNTGKSTAGNVLYALFNALKNVNEKSYKVRVKKCEHILFSIKESLNPSHVFVMDDTCYSIAKSLVAKTLSIDEIVVKLRAEYPDNQIPADWEMLKERLRKILDIQEDELQKEVVRSCFTKILGEQFVPLFKNHGAPSAYMVIKGEKLGVKFEKDVPEFEVPLALRNSAFYQEDSSLLNDSRPGKEEQYFRIIESFEKQNDIIDNILLRKKCEEAKARLSDILKGEIICDAIKQTFFLESSKYTGPLEFDGLSQGMKSMAALQALFSHGAVGDRDILIPDEPEIHLHPEWQIKYAELIVLLQKAFHLTVLLTSHSPDFVEAIHLYSQKHGIAEKLNGYISEIQNENGTVSMRKIANDDWDEMFDKFAKSVDLLMDLRSDVEKQSHE